MRIPQLRLALLCLVVAVLGLVALPLLAQTTTQETQATEPTAAAVVHPRVELDTSAGRIVIELYPDKAPNTVANFLSYVKDGHYNGTVFHRVIADLLIQGGAFTPDLQQKPERPAIANEAHNGLSNLRGTIAAARKPIEKNSAAAQFFINTVDNRQFDYKGDDTAFNAGYCVFGRVVEGLDVVDKIRAAPTAARAPFASDVPTTPVVIEHATEIEATP